MDYNPIFDYFSSELWSWDNDKSDKSDKAPISIKETKAIQVLFFTMIKHYISLIF